MASPDPRRKRPPQNPKEEFDFDVLTLGEALIHLSPPGFERLENVRGLEVRVSGPESNLAIALARLGARVTWVGKFPDHPLARLAARRIQGHGVDVSQVVWMRAGTGRMGLVLLERGAEPRPRRTYPDRQQSAGSTLSAEEIDWPILERVRHVHLTGVTPAISARCHEAVARAAREARDRDRTVSLDIAYRSQLWGPHAARLALAPVIAEADLVICSSDDARLVFQLEGSPEQLARGLGALSRRPDPVVAVTLGAGGALLVRGEQVLGASAYQVDVVERASAGEAFAAGLLWGFLNDDLQQGLDYGTAMAALQHTFPGEEFQATRDEVEMLISGAPPGVSL